MRCIKVAKLSNGLNKVIYSDYVEIKEGEFLTESTLDDLFFIGMVIITSLEVIKWVHFQQLKD